MNPDLIAPCGMNCRLCYGYIRTKNPCAGCNGPEAVKPKSCTNCKIVICEKRIANGWTNCAPCDKHCRRLKDLDKRYREKYHMSMIDNLTLIREEGMETFLTDQEGRFTCPVCGEILCVHRKECPGCGTESW